MAAVNTIGQGPSSDVVEARTAEQAPSSPPRQVRDELKAIKSRVICTTHAVIIVPIVFWGVVLVALAAAFGEALPVLYAGQRSYA